MSENPTTWELAPPTPLSPNLGNQPNPPRPVESIVNDITSNLNFSVGPVKVPFGSWLAEPLHPFASLIDDGIDLVYDLGLVVWGGVEWLGQEAWTVIQETGSELLHDAENLYNEAVGFATNLGTEVLHDAENLFNEAVSEAETLGTEVLHDAENLFNEAVSEAETLGTEVLHDAENLFNEAVSTAESVGTEVLHDAEGLYNEAVGLINTGIADAEHIAQGLFTDAENIARGLVQDAESLASSALDAFGRDIVDPLVSEFDTLKGDVLGGITDGINLVEKVAGWLEWLATFPFTTAEEAWAFFTDGNPVTVLAAVRQAVEADNGAVAHFARQLVSPT